MGPRRLRPSALPSSPLLLPSSNPQAALLLTPFPCPPPRCTRVSAVTQVTYEVLQCDRVSLFLVEPKGAKGVMTTTSRTWSHNALRVHIDSVMGCLLRVPLLSPR